MKYSPSQLKQKNRKRQIISFNPPYSVNVKTNVGKLFMRLTDKHFPRHSHIPSMKNVIQKHNSKIIEDPKPTSNKICSC